MGTINDNNSFGKEHELFAAVKEFAGDEKCLIILDSMHTEEHVLAELETYHVLSHPGDYIVVCDTIVNNPNYSVGRERPWGKNNNPYTALCKFLNSHQDFITDKNIEQRLLVSCQPNGYIYRK